MLVCLPLAAPIGLSPLHILTRCGSERVLVVLTEQVHPDAYSKSMLGLLTPALTCVRWCVHAWLAEGGGGGWHKASVLGCLPLAAPICLSPLHILTRCGSERVLVVSTEPLDDLSCLTTPGSVVPETGCCPCR